MNLISMRGVENRFLISSDLIWFTLFVSPKGILWDFFYIGVIQSGSLLLVLNVE